MSDRHSDLAELALRGATARLYQPIIGEADLQAAQAEALTSIAASLVAIERALRALVVAKVGTMNEARAAAGLARLPGDCRCGDDACYLCFPEGR